MSVVDNSNILKYKLAVAHEEMNPRRRNTMEDCHRILPSLFDMKEYSYFGIYDGHGGRQIVDFLEESLEHNIVNELKQMDDASIEERLTRLFSFVPLPINLQLLFLD
jgi:serine/threonine protein phosphatase PrpC